MQNLIIDIRFTKIDLRSFYEIWFNLTINELDIIIIIYIKF